MRPISNCARSRRPAPGRGHCTTGRVGAAPLDDLRFRTGASELSATDYPSLLALAAFLAENPDRRVVLVGHTDAEGGRDSNIALSEAAPRLSAAT
jgi:hypothetical protein